MYKKTDRELKQTEKATKEQGITVNLQASTGRLDAIVEFRSREVIGGIQEQNKLKESFQQPTSCVYMPGTSPELSNELMTSRMASVVIWKSSIRNVVCSPLMPFCMCLYLYVLCICRYMYM